MKRKCELIFALDKSKRRDFIYWLDATKDLIAFYKVGLIAFTALGKDAITLIKKKKKKVFLDLKFFDIPNTMAGASLNAVNWGVDILDFHLLAGPSSLTAALRGIKKASERKKKNLPIILGVTVLTSEVQNSTIQFSVLKLARQALRVGFDGVVASGKDAKAIRERIGNKIIIASPGIRLEKTRDDQRRTVRPKDVRGYADFIIAGRPIYESKNPRGAIVSILDELKE